MAPMKRPAKANPPHSLPLARVAQRWHTNIRQIRKLLQCGELPFEQVNGQLRVPLSSVREYEKQAKRLKVGN